MAEQAGSFGSYLDRDIIKQIEVRQNIQGRKAPTKETKFTERDYQVLYHNTPWVCLRSSVNAPPVGAWKPGKDTTVTSAASRNFILCGGTLKYEGMNGENPKLSFTGEPNISVKGRVTPGYVKDTVTGYRPRPGITKVTVKTKDTFGCIMEASVDFMVYSRDELELIDQIYFKPGMTALLEWGHTSYHNSLGVMQHMTARDLYPFNRFFGTVPFETIETEVQNFRKSKNISESKVNEAGFCGNYEALYGYITNFSYSFNSNGSYTCNVKILSKGSILEGLQIPSNLGSKCKVIVEDSDELENGKQESSIKTAFHNIFSVARARFDTKEEEDIFHPVNVQCTWEDKETDSYEFYGKRLIQDRWFVRGDQKTPISYLKLNTFLHIINRVIKSANVDYVPFEVEPLGEVDVHRGEPYVSFNEHFSLNPGVVVLPTEASVTGSDYNTEPGTKDSEDNDLSVGDVLKRTTVGLPTGPLSGQHNLIGDLWINTDFILSIIDGIIDGETQKYSIKDLIEGVLNGVQKAMGNVNSFGIEINEVTGKATIVDRNCIASKIVDQADQDPPIIVSGVYTTVTDLKITSEVSAEIANEMSIAATAPKDGTSLANIDQVFWNEGCVDRHRLPEVKINPVTDLNSIQRMQQTFVKPIQRSIMGTELLPVQSVQEDPLKGKPFYKSCEFLGQVYNLYTNFIVGEAVEELVDKENNQSFCQYVESSYNNLQRDGEDLFKMCVNRDVNEAAGQGGASEASYLQAGVIPIKVSFTMKGIGRFVIGTTFRISEGLVLRKYKNWRNIITGVEHNIDKGGWTTTVTALYYPAFVKVTKPESVSKLTVPVMSEIKPVGNSFVETILPTGQAIEQPKDTVERFFRYFWKHTETKPSVCAAYVSMMAKSWATGTLHTTGGWGNAGYVIPSSNTSLFAKDATDFGWVIDWGLTKINTSKATVQAVCNAVTNIGDIVVYYWKNPNVKEQNGYLYYQKDGSLQHVQMKMPNMKLVLGKGGTVSKKYYAPGSVVKADSTWTTSTYNNYGCQFVYGHRNELPDLWDVWVLHAPKINEKWATVKV